MDSKKKQTEFELTGGVAYLIFYNFMQAMGWTMMTSLIIGHYLESGHVGLYQSGYLLLNIFQTLAILEVVHPMLGLVKTNVMLTGFQVASRIFVTWGIAHTVPMVQDNVGVAMFMLAWGVTEIIRYSYYMCAQVQSIPYILQWCRYTFFIVLYPIGVTGELLSIYGSLSYISEKEPYTVHMPNKYNMGFSYYYMCILAMVMYVPIFPQLYLHMFAQRKKILGGDKKKME